MQLIGIRFAHAVDLMIYESTLTGKPISRERQQTFGERRQIMTNEMNNEQRDQRDDPTIIVANGVICDDYSGAEF